MLSVSLPRNSMIYESKQNLSSIQQSAVIAVALTLGPWANQFANLLLHPDSTDLCACATNDRPRNVKRQPVTACVYHVYVKLSTNYFGAFALCEISSFLKFIYGWFVSETISAAD